MEDPKVWIVTSGRAGSSIFMGIMGRLGVDVIGKGTDHMTEHDSIVDLNDLIISTMRKDLKAEAAYEKYRYYSPLRG